MHASLQILEDKEGIKSLYKMVTPRLDCSSGTHQKG